MKLKFLLAALVTVAAASCQQKGETAIEVNLTDIPENCRIDVSRVEGRGGQTIYIDSSKTTERKFTLKCDSITDNTSFTIFIQKITDKGQALAYTGTILVADGYTTKVSGKGIYPSTWTIDSKHPKQAFLNKLDEGCKDLKKQIDEIRLASDTVSSRESRMKLYDLQDEIYDKISEKQFALMETLPIDEYWLEELGRYSGTINYEGKDYKYYDKVEALYNKMPDEYKNSKIGKALNLALYAKAPAVGDQINDYDLYDINGKVHHLADYKGKWLLLDFSSYFCGPCRMFDASVKYFYERGIGKNFEIITITADTEGQFAQMVAEEKPNHPLLNDRDGTAGLFALNKIAGTPTFHLVNPDGKIEDIFMGVDLGKIIKLMKEHDGFAAG
jgi:peroxiredoxin